MTKEPWEIWDLMRINDLEAERDEANRYAEDLEAQMDEVKRDAEEQALVEEVVDDIRFRENQAKAGRNRWNKKALNERNQKMTEHFKRTRLTPSSFAEDKKNQKKYGLKPRQIRTILKMAVGN